MAAHLAWRWGNRCLFSYAYLNHAVPGSVR
jgi:hypothetical protein